MEVERRLSLRELVISDADDGVVIDDAPGRLRGRKRGRGRRRVDVAGGGVMQRVMKGIRRGVMIVIRDALRRPSFFPSTAATAASLVSLLQSSTFVRMAEKTADLRRK